MERELEKKNECIAACGEILVDLQKVFILYFELMIKSISFFSGFLDKLPEMLLFCSRTHEVLKIKSAQKQTRKPIEVLMNPMLSFKPTRLILSFKSFTPFLHVLLNFSTRSISQDVVLKTTPAPNTSPNYGIFFQLTSNFCSKNDPDKLLKVAKGK